MAGLAMNTSVGLRKTIRSMEARPHRRRETLSGHHGVLGTYYHLSPEQAMAKSILRPPKGATPMARWPRALSERDSPRLRETHGEGYGVHPPLRPRESRAGAGRAAKPEEQSKFAAPPLGKEGKRKALSV